jgi:predicted AlkP superfamily pyrophosphatase or phosphodiesterase
MRLKAHTLLISLLLWPCFAPQAPAAEKPRLVVFISIDQMRADFLDRYAREYTYGFKTLMSEGVVYANADLNYSGSATGPGHATLGTGVYPWKSGIVSNNYKERSTNARVYCVEDSTALPVEGEGGKRSPKKLLVTGLADWLRAASPSSRVVSLSFKDRAAILMGGKHPDYAFWYDDKSGHMVTSSYYAQHVPEWVKKFNAAEWYAQLTPPSWTKFRSEEVYSAYGPDNLPGEKPWHGSIVFPYPLSSKKRAEQISETPYGNALLLEFARTAIKGEALGQRGVTDLLCVSLTTTDKIGHGFGPNSHEMIDNLLRLDQDLGTFLLDLEAAIGREHLIVVLSADHGSTQLPEYRTNVEHRFARRFDNHIEIARALGLLDSLLRSEFRTQERIVGEGFVNYAAAKVAGMDERTIEKRIREALVHVDGVEDVYFLREMLDANTPDRPYLERFRHSTIAERSADFAIRRCEFCLITSDSTGSSHGSPYVYDTHVPMVFWGWQLPARKIDRTVHTVDIAATLARLLGAQAPGNIDGVLLEEVAR